MSGLNLDILSWRRLLHGQIEHPCHHGGWGRRGREQYLEHIHVTVARGQQPRIILCVCNFAVPKGKKALHDRSVSHGGGKLNRKQKSLRKHGETLVTEIPNVIPVIQIDLRSGLQQPLHKRKIALFRCHTKTVDAGLQTCFCKHRRNTNCSFACVDDAALSRHPCWERRSCATRQLVNINSKTGPGKKMVARNHFFLSQ